MLMHATSLATLTAFIVVIYYHLITLQEGLKAARTLYSKYPRISIEVNINELKICLEHR
jgi:hypothetical protein